MKQLFLALLFVGFAATASAQVAFVTKPTDTVHEMARQAQKLIFVDLYATWCPPCQMMDKQVFSNQKVGEFMNSHFINVKYDIEKLPGKDFAKKYDVKSIPTFLIFNTEGDLLGRITGGSDAQEFLSYMQKIIDNKSVKK